MILYRILIVTMFCFVSSFIGLTQDSNVFSGKIAYIGVDSNVYSIDLETQVTYQLTDNGSVTSSYESPTWSRDGKLVYFCCSSPDLETSGLFIYLSEDGTSEGSIMYRGETERHVYAFWSPVACLIDLCVDLAVLIQDFTQPRLRVELFNSKNLETGQRNLGEGIPFYYSWNPSGDSLVLYRDSEKLQYYVVESANIDMATTQTLGTFLAPAWSPTDNRILIAVSNSEGKSQLAILNNSELDIVTEEVDGLLSFSWSPNGDYIAYRVADRNALSSLFIIDAETGEMISKSSVAGVISFFWSPDSSKIAYITLSDSVGSFDIKNNENMGYNTYLVQSISGFAWNILNIDESSNVLLNNFVPSLEMQYMLNNFEQFSQSHSFWSPDSRYLVYSHYEEEDYANPIISILDTANLTSEIEKLASGKLAIWSYR